jgi:hypothetical protein
MPILVAAVLALTACGSSPTPTTRRQPGNMTISNMPSYPPAPSTGLLAAAPDFTFVKGCQHPCTAPVRLDVGNASPAMVTSWPCEGYVATGTGFCIDAAKARQKTRDQVLVVCRKMGNTDRQDGNLSDDRGNPTRDWFQVIVPKAIAATIATPHKPPLVSDGTYRGYIFGGWLRKATDPVGFPGLDVTAPDC